MSYEVEFKKFLRKRRLKGLSEKTLKDDADQVHSFLSWVGGQEITSELVLNYLDYLNAHTYTRKGITRKYSKCSLFQAETKLKLFLNTIDPELCVDIQPRMPKTRKIPEDLLSEEDIEKLINACQTFRDQALVSFLFEAGVRRGELLSIKKNNIVFDSLGAVITIPEGKTGARRIRVVFSAMYLRLYVENHPNHAPDSYLFCSVRAPYGRLSVSGLKEQLDVIAKRAGINKKVFPHLFRHSAATRLAKHLSEQSLKTYLGWTQGSSMAAVYVHMSGQDVDPYILKMNGLEVEDAQVASLQVSRCPRCHELLPKNSAYCKKCGLPLQDEVKAKIDRELAEIDLEVMKAAITDPTVLDKLAEKIAKYQNNSKK